MFMAPGVVNIVNDTMCAGIHTHTHTHTLTPPHTHTHTYMG